MKYSEGFNILVNNGKVADQYVFHVHFHLVPRREGDNVEIGNWRHPEGIDMDKVQEEVKTLLKE